MTANSQKTISRARRKRRKLSQQVSGCGRLIKASLVLNRRRCGKPGCRCVEGELHESLAFTYKQDGKSVLLHIPEHLEAEARKANKDYRKLKALVEKLSGVNIELLKHKARTVKPPKR